MMRRVDHDDVGSGRDVRSKEINLIVGYFIFNMDVMVYSSSFACFVFVLVSLQVSDENVFVTPRYL
jgi:hypothetical protein